MENKVEDVYTLSYCSPTQLENFGLTIDHIKALHQFLNDYEYEENVLSQEHQEFHHLKSMVQDLGQFKGFELLQYPKFNKQDILDPETYRSIIVIGETGTGKTTFINFFLNSYLDVQIDDNFRYILVSEDQRLSQAVSRTSDVNIYYIKPYHGKQGLKIIDTPGFCDTQGVQQDQIIVKQIEDCLKLQVESLSTICFLIKSSACRLTIPQNYVLSQIFSMFAIDIIQNFVFLFTFYDGAGEPQALDALKYPGNQENKASVVYDKIKLIDPPWYLKTNNSCLFEKNSSPLTQVYWDLASNCMRDLYFTKIIRNTEQSLTLTKEVIDKRNEIAMTLMELRKVIKIQLDEKTNLKNIQKQIEQLNNELKDTENFKVKDVKYISQRIDLKQGEYATNCMICNQTCHYPCRLADEERQKCSVMKKGKCTKCKDKCNWKLHNNMQFRLEDKAVEVETEFKDRKIQHQIILQDKNSKKILMNCLEKKITNLVQQQMEIQVALSHQINYLKQISSQPNCCQYQEQYVDLMIKQEEGNKQEGYISRIYQLKEMKEYSRLIRTAETQAGSDYEAQQFLNNLQQIRQQQTKEQNIELEHDWTFNNESYNKQDTQQQTNESTENVQRKKENTILKHNK